MLLPLPPTPFRRVFQIAADTLILRLLSPSGSMAVFLLRDPPSADGGGLGENFAPFLETPLKIAGNPREGWKPQHQFREFIGLSFTGVEQFLALLFLFSLRLSPSPPLDSCRAR